MKPSPRPFHSFLPTLTLALATLASCASTSGASSERWLEPSPTLEQQIEDQVRRLPWAHGEARVEMIHWFASVGEPAYGRLLELCVDPRPPVASSAVAALGASGDSRLVEPMNALAWPAVLHPQVKYERARTMVRLGDWTHVGELVDGLEEPSLWTRAWCAQALEEATHQRFGFEPSAGPEERAQAVARWRGWMKARNSEGILLTRND
jgi:hypothetical protein